MDDSKFVGRVSCPMGTVSRTLQSLDTVRALHQTVVSLRTALEEAKSEIQKLRSQIKVQSDIAEGAKEREILAPKPPVEVPIKKDVEPEVKQPQEQSKVDVVVDDPEEAQKQPQQTQDEPQLQQQQPEPSISEESQLQPQQQPNKPSIPEEPQQQLRPAIPEEPQKPPPPSVPEEPQQKPQPSIPEVAAKPEDAPAEPRPKVLTSKPRYKIVPQFTVVRHPATETMNSKIDVKIKLTSTVATEEPKPEKIMEEIKEVKIEEEPKLEEASQTAQPKDALAVSRPKKHLASSSEFINFDDNDTSQSEGDNSVFHDDPPMPTEEEGAAAVDTKPAVKEKDPESKDEVDDIELIFSSGESRDPIQEDLVSISELDPWQTGGSGTPVLVKFSSLPSDQEPPSREPKHKPKMPTSTSHDVFLESERSSPRLRKSMDSADSFDNNHRPASSSLDNEYGSDLKEELRSIGRDESLDFFDHRDCHGAGRKWTNCNVFVETDISKCGIIEETTFEMYRRNTCPNPPAYRPVLHRESTNTSRHIPPRLTSRYGRRIYGQGCMGQTITPRQTMADKGGPKRSSSAQTEISALPEHWKSESQLARDRYHLGGQCTLPSKFVPTPASGLHKHSLRVSDRTQEARRVLLSDINFTSMVPELSRSADHLCQGEEQQEQSSKPSSRYYKGNLLKTPDYALKGITPSVSMTSPGVSQWTVNESSFGTQTIQTGESWGKRGDSFDSCRSYSIGSRFSELDPHHRSRSVPSIRCAICKLAHGGHGIRTSESMHYTPRVTVQEPCKIRGSLPDLRHDCMCSRRYTGRTIFTIHGDSSGSTESLLDEADTFVRKSMESALLMEDVVTTKRPSLRRMSETDIQRDYIPSKQSLPFLPKTAKCLKLGHLAKVISKNGRVVVGRVRYVGPLVSTDKNGSLVADDLYVGVQLPSKCGDCDGTFNGRKFFECEPLQGLFVPFKKVVMAWTG